MALFEELRFFNGIKDWEPNKKIEVGTMRFIKLGTGLNRVVAIIMANLDRTSRAALDAAELGTDKVGQNQNNWTLVNQEQSSPWHAKDLFITGTKVKLGGFVGEYHITGQARDDFDYTEIINFGFIATAATGLGSIVYQRNHGLTVGNWATCGPDGYVLAQPDNAVLRETDGVISRVINDHAFILESEGFGSDLENTDNEDFWNYDIGTVLYLAKDGTITDTKPTGIARRLAKIVDYGFARIDMETEYPRCYQPDFDVWPSDDLLKMPLDNGGFRIFYYVGAEAGRQIGTWMNPNCGKTAISPPVRL